MKYVDYAIFDRNDRPIFRDKYFTVADAMQEVQEMLRQGIMFPTLGWGDIFPVTIEGRTSSDIYERITSITWEIGE